jgi:hypothetical protein
MSSEEFSLTKSKQQLWIRGGRISERDKKKHSPGWQVGFCFYLPSLNLTRIWRASKSLSAPLNCLITLG